MTRHTRLSVLFLLIFALLFFVDGQAASAERLWVAESIDIRELFGRMTHSEVVSFGTYMYNSDKKYSEMMNSGYSTAQIAAVAMRDFKRILQEKDYDAAKTILDAMYLSAVGRANVEHIDMIDNAREFFLGNSDFWKPPRRQKNSGRINK